MGEFMIECTLCGLSFGSEKQYDSHPCMEEDVKVPFKIKMEQDDEEAELENEVQKVLQQASITCKDEPLTMPTIKDEPIDFEYEDLDPLGFTQEEEACRNKEMLESLGNNSIVEEPAPDVDVASVSESPINECLICGKRFFRREDFLTHKANSHKVPRPYDCKICKKKFTQKHYVTLHMRVHTGERPYKCGLCSNTYTHKTSYTIHMRIHNGDRPYRCGLCGKRCYDKSGLTSHMRSHTKETPYECEVCGRRFTHSKSLLVHRRNHTGEKPYKCPYCGKCFRHWHKHKIHIRLHTGERPYRCKVCGKGFPRNDEVKRHMRSHQGIKSFKCSICSVYCATQASITGHIDLHHSDLKPDNPLAPEKTVVRNSLSGILGTKAPQPRTIYKPIASLAAANAIASSSSVVTTSEANSEKSMTNSNVQTKTLSYKEYMELQEKMLADKGLTVTEPKRNQVSQGVVIATSKNSISYSSSSSSNIVSTTVAPSQGVLASNGNQIMIVSPQNLASGSGLQLVLPKPLPGGVQGPVTTMPASNVPGQQLVFNQSPMVIPQSQLVGGQMLGGQQLILLSPSGTQQNNLAVSQPLLLLTGAGGSSGQRLVLMPKPISGPVAAGTQTVMIPSGSLNTSFVTSPNLANTTVHIKQEVVEPVSAVTEEKLLKSVIKQEPGIQAFSGTIIKQEPEETSSVLANNFCNIVIKKEIEDTNE